MNTMTADQPPSDVLTGPVARVGRYRWLICGLLFFAATVNYVDRQVIGFLKPTLQHQFGWSANRSWNIMISANWQRDSVTTSIDANPP